MFIHPAHISKALVQNIRIKSFSSRYKSNSKVQHRTYHQSPHDRIYPSDLDKIRCKYICRDRTYAAAHRRLLSSLLPEQTSHKRPKECAFKSAKCKHVEHENYIRRIDRENHHHHAEQHRKYRAHQLDILVVFLIFHRIITHHVILPQILHYSCCGKYEERICCRHDCCHRRCEEYRCYSRRHDLLYYNMV